MKKISYFFFTLFLLLISPSLGMAQGTAEIVGNLPEESYFRAQVSEIPGQGEREVFDGVSHRYQQLRLTILNGEDEGRQVRLEHGGSFDLQESQLFEVGQQLVLKKTELEGQVDYSLVEPYRLNGVLIAFALFILLAFAISRWQGLSAFVGMMFSLFVIIFWAIPAIAEGRSPFVVSFLSTVVIAVTSLYLAHGFKKRTTIALCGILITVGFAIVLSVLLTGWLGLTGAGSEEAFSLQLFNLPNLDLKGLFLGGMIIGALGVLDDVTMGQSATVEELKKANPNLDFKELYRRGMSVGREHISSLVNTLALAYAGASFPLLILFYVNDQLPVWVILNNEAMTEEIVRTLVGSAALLLAVPIITFLAAYFFQRTEKLKT